jgi:hypothetical protein
MRIHWTSVLVYAAATVVLTLAVLALAALGTS